MILDPKRKREIRQLMFVAERYLSLSEPARHQASRKLGDTAAHFESGATPSGEIQQLTFLAADLSSAGIRLATIDEILYRADSDRPGYKTCVRYFSWKDLPEGSALPNDAEWLHVMLRDSIGHDEPPQGRTTSLATRRGERQDLIEGLSFARAYETLKSIAVKLRSHLEEEHHIELTPAIG